MNEMISKTIENLKKNGFNVKYFETAVDAKTNILKEVTADDEVGIGGSMTIYDMEIHKELIERGNTVYWHWLEDSTKRAKVREKASRAQVYLSSSNAITQDGKLINIDGMGNRVASIIYGHEKVYIIAGVNKLTKDVTEGIKRIKEVACPQNATRLGISTPCRNTGKCYDCKTLQRMCNVTVILDRNPMKANINIYLINEDLGY